MLTPSPSAKNAAASRMLMIKFFIDSKEINPCNPCLKKLRA